MADTDVLDAPEVQTDEPTPPEQPPQQPTSGDDKLRALYNATSQKFDLGSYDDFKTKMQDPNKRQAFYGAASKQFDLGDYNTFQGKIGYQAQTPEHQIVENPFTKVDNNFFNNHIQNPSESTSIGVTKPNIVVPKSFQSPHDLMNKNVADAHNKLQQAFAKSSDDVIDALNEQKHNQDYYNSLQGGKSKQDATAVATLPPPVRLPDQIKADREQFKQVAQQEPELARKVLSGVATTPELKSALYTVDAQNRPQNAHLINQNIEGIKKGELNYNSEHQQVIKNLPFAQSIVKGVQDHTQTMNDYDDYKKMSDDQILAKEAKATNNFNPDIPKEVPSGVGGMIGSNAVPLAKGVGASAVAGLLPETLAAASPWLAAMYSSSDFYKTAYANTLRTTLQKQIANGVDPHVALQKAKDDANFNANLAYAQGVAMTAAGLKLGGKIGGEYTPTQSVKNILKDFGTQSTIAGVAKVAENVHSGDAPLKDIEETVGTNGLFMLALGALHSPDLTVKAFKAVRNSVVPKPQEMINQTLADGVKTGIFTPEAAQDIHNKVAEVKQNATGLPPDVPEENIPKIQKLIQRRTELENQMDKDHPSYVDPAYHAEIKEQINGVKKETADGKTEGKDGINEQIRKLSQPSKEETEQQPIQTFKKSAGVTLPEEKEGAALEQGKVTEGGTAPSNSIQTNDNYKTAYVGNHEGKQEFKNFTVDGETKPIAGNEKELESNPNAKLDKSESSQTENKQQQVKNISKWNVPLDADENGKGGKGDTMAESVGRVVGQYLKDKAETDGHTAIITHSSVLKMIKTYEELKDSPEFKDADWNHPEKWLDKDGNPDAKAKAFTKKYNSESTNNGDTEEFDAGNGKKIYVSRHGQTEDNLTGKFRTEDTQLTDKGRDQAKEVGKTLKEKGVDKTISSPFDRATETSQIAMKEMEGGKKGVSVVRPEENKSPKVISPIKNEKIPYDDFREEMLDHFKNQKDSKFDWRVSNELSQSEREKGVFDLRNGKNSAAAKKVEAAIKDMYDKGVVPMNRGRGTQVQSHDFDFKDLGYTQETVNGIEKNLHDWLSGESELTPEDELFIENNIDKIIQNETENERQNKPITGISKATGTENIGEEVGGNDRPIEPTGEGGQQPPTEEKGKTTGEEEAGRDVGISHDAMNKLNKRLGLPEVERGESMTPEKYADIGRALKDRGVDPETVLESNLKQYEKAGVARAYLEELTKDADNIQDKSSKQYKDAVAKIADFEKNVIGVLGNEWHQLGQSLQGSRDLDTDSFTAVSSKIEKNSGKPLTDKQTQKVTKLTEKNKELKSKLDEANEKLVKATDKSILKESGKPSRAKLSTQLKDIAKRLRTSSEFDDFLKGASGEVQKMGVDLPRLKEIAASILEDAAKVVEKGENAIEFIRKAVKELKDDVDKDKLSEALIGIGEKQGLFETKETPEEAFEKKKNQGLVKSKMEKPLTDAEKIESDQKELEGLQNKFADKKGNSFTPDEKKDIYGYMKKNYLNKGVTWRDAIKQTANDIGLSFKQVSSAIITPETKPISIERWKANSDLLKNRAATERYVNEQEQNKAIKMYKTAVNAIREEKVFGHSGIFVGTHSGMTLTDLPRVKYTIKALLNGYKLSYGDEHFYNTEMENLKNSPNYLIAQKAGLKNNPDIFNNDEEIISTKLGWFSKAGVRGFNAIKVLRQDLFDNHFNRLTEAEKQDPNSAISIAHLVNNATGASNLNMPAWVGEVTFAGGMEAARWGKLTKNPLKAGYIALKALTPGAKVSVGEKVFAKVWASRVGWELGTYAIILAANAAIQYYLSGDKNKVNYTDPTKSDFMKMKFGNTTFDFTSGMLSTLHFASQTINLLKNENPYRRGKQEPLINTLGANTMKYGVGKLSPFYGEVAETALRHDYNGNTVPWSNDRPLHKWNHKLTWKEYAASKLPLPIAEGFNSFYESARQNGMSDKEIDNVLTGIKNGAISGLTGFKAYETNDKNK